MGHCDVLRRQSQRKYDIARLEARGSSGCKSASNVNCAGVRYGPAAPRDKQISNCAIFAIAAPRLLPN